MREVFVDFLMLSQRPELGLGPCIPLGREDTHPELAGLQDGERVLLVEWDEAQAVGIARCIERDVIRSWYGLVSRKDIHALDPDADEAFEQIFDPESPGMRYLQGK